MLGVITHHSSLITPVFIPQTKYTEQCSASQAGSRGVSGHWGEKCWSQLMVRVERGNTDTGAALRVTATADCSQWDQLRVALVWSQHQCPESRGACLVLTDKRQLMRSGLAVSAWKWGLRTLPGKLLQTVCCRGHWGWKQSEKLEQCDYWWAGELGLWLSQRQESVFATWSLNW